MITEDEKDVNKDDGEDLDKDEEVIEEKMEEEITAEQKNIRDDMREMAEAEEIDEKLQMDREEKVELGSVESIQKE